MTGRGRKGGESLARLVVTIVASALVLLTSCTSTEPAPEATSPTPTSNVPVNELGKADCEAAGHDWTATGCRTEAKSQRLQDEETAEQRRSERKALRRQGWDAFAKRLDVIGVYYKPFTLKQYQTVSGDPRCAESDGGCVAFMIRTDSLTSCAGKFVIEGNIVNKGVIVGSTGGSVRSLPTGSKARVVLAIRRDPGEYEFGENIFKTTKAACT